MLWVYVSRRQIKRRQNPIKAPQEQAATAMLRNLGSNLYKARARPLEAFFSQVRKTHGNHVLLMLLEKHLGSGVVIKAHEKRWAYSERECF